MLVVLSGSRSPASLLAGSCRALTGCWDLLLEVSLAGLWLKLGSVRREGALWRLLCSPLSPECCWNRTHLCLRFSRALGTRTAQMEEICLLPAHGGSKKAEAGRVGWFVINSVREFLDLWLQPRLEAVLEFQTAWTGKSAVLLHLEWSLKCRKGLQLMTNNCVYFWGFAVFWKVGRAGAWGCWG